MRGYRKKDTNEKRANGISRTAIQIVLVCWWIRKMRADATARLLPWLVIVSLVSLTLIGGRARSCAQASPNDIDPLILKTPEFEVLTSS